MVVLLDLTEEMIKCFNNCVKNGEYSIFATDKKYKKFLKDVSDNLKKVAFSDDPYNIISRDFKFCFDYVLKWNPKDPQKISGTGNLEKRVPELVEDLKSAIEKKNWDKFYCKYRSIADFMISEARNQGKIDFNIHSGADTWESFEERDFVANANSQIMDEHKPIVNPANMKNSGILIAGLGQPEVVSSGNYIINISIGDEEQTLTNDSNRAKLFSETSVPEKQSSSRIELENDKTSIEPRRSDRLKSKSENRMSTKKSEESSTLSKKFSSSSSQNFGFKSLKKPPDSLIPRKTSPSPVEYGGITLTPDTTNQRILDELRQTREVSRIQRPENYDEQKNYEKYLCETQQQCEPKYLRQTEVHSPPHNFRESSIHRDSPVSDNESFNEKLHEQQVRHVKELEEKQRERRRKQEKFNEELQKMKSESKLRFEILLKCILMKHRFEEQEQYWKEWIGGCRNHIIQLLNQSNYFFDDIQQNYGGLRHPERIDTNQYEVDTLYLFDRVMIAFNGIQDDFENLKRVEGKCPDVLFVRVLQKCLADVGRKLLDIYKYMENLGVDKHRMSGLHDLFGDLSPNLIYSTSQLHDICRNPTRSYYNIEFPDLPHSYAIHELFDD